jgi:hypothetical protein
MLTVIAHVMVFIVDNSLIVREEGGKGVAGPHGLSSGAATPTLSEQQATLAPPVEPDVAHRNPLIGPRAEANSSERAQKAHGRCILSNCAEKL